MNCFCNRLLDMLCGREPFVLNPFLKKLFVCVCSDKFVARIISERQHSENYYTINILFMFILFEVHITLLYSLLIPYIVSADSSEFIYVESVLNKCINDTLRPSNHCTRSRKLISNVASSNPELLRCHFLPNGST